MISPRNSLGLKLINLFQDTATRCPLLFKGVSQSYTRHDLVFFVVFHHHYYRLLLIMMSGFGPVTPFNEGLWNHTKYRARSYSSRSTHQIQHCETPTTPSELRICIIVLILQYAFIISHFCDFGTIYFLVYLDLYCSSLQSKTYVTYPNFRQEWCVMSW